jgi:hypothetical protein
MFPGKQSFRQWLRKQSKQSGFFPTGENRDLESFIGAARKEAGYTTIQTRSNARSESVRKDDKIEGEI